ncbi:serine/threonine-protein kinase [Nocardia sp. MW-W600-9]
MLDIGEVFAGFTIERMLGQGGMGTVYLARHPRLDRLTALKLLNRDLFADERVRARFEREADLAAGLDHPGIVTVFDRGTEGEQLWISMQYVDGIDAATVDPMTLPPERAVQIVEGVADALDYAHGRGVLHRDVKPANILLARSSGGQGERVFLTDFGIARLRADSTHLTQQGMFTATLAYASPEQMTGAELDHRSDQYSLACALYWLLTGIAPFDSPDPNEIIRGTLYLNPPPLALRRQGLPPALDAVLAAAMAKHPAARFDSCTAFAKAARQALTSNTPPSLPRPRPTPPPSTHPPPRAPTRLSHPATAPTPPSRYRLPPNPRGAFPTSPRPRQGPPPCRSGPQPRHRPDTPHRTPPSHLWCSRVLSPLWRSSPLWRNSRLSLSRPWLTLRRRPDRPRHRLRRRRYQPPNRICPRPVSRRRLPSWVHSSRSRIRPRARIQWLPNHSRPTTRAAGFLPCPRRPQSSRPSYRRLAGRRMLGISQARSRLRRSNRRVVCSPRGLGQGPVKKAGLGGRGIALTGSLLPRCAASPDRRSGCRPELRWQARSPVMARSFRSAKSRVGQLVPGPVPAARMPIRL